MRRMIALLRDDLLIELHDVLGTDVNTKATALAKQLIDTD
jgi:hypothetical protein